MRRYIIPLILLMFACRQVPSALNRHELTRFCDDPRNGLAEERATPEWTLRLAYKPVELIIAQRYDEAVASQRVVDSLREHLGDAMYFVLTVEKQGSSALNALRRAYGNRFDSVYGELLYGQAGNWWMRTGADSVRCAFYQLENRGNVDPRLVFTFAFDGPPQSDFDIVWKDSIITHSTQTFHYKIEDLHNMPTLITTTSNP